MSGTLIQPNKVGDFDPNKFTIVGFCADCDYSAPVKAGEDMEIPTLKARLSCSHCGSRNTSIRIIYTGAGGYEYRRHRPEFQQ